MADRIFNENLWTPIPRHYPYEAYPTGEIRNMITKKILSPFTVNCRGYDTKYQQVKLTINGKRIGRYVHRLIAMTFLPWPSMNLDEYDVDHLDYDPSHNDILNLRWMPKKINNMLKSNATAETRQRAVEEYLKMFE